MTNESVVTLSDPYPLLDPGQYVAACTTATFAWAKQWKKWMARLVLEPQDYRGRPYHGKLCKFLSLGRDPAKPFAGQHSDFRKLYVEVNGAQPVGHEVTMRIFEGHLYEITVDTVRLDRDRKERRPEHWYSIVREIHLAASMPQRSNTPPFYPSTERTLRTLSTDQYSNTENTPLAERKQALRFALSQREGAR